MNLFDHVTSFIHPMIVHFPIALLITTVVLEAFYLFTKKEKLHTATWYTLLVGVLFAYFAIATGPEDVNSPLLEYHETFAWITTFLFTFALVWRYAKEQIPYFKKINLRFLYPLILILGLISVSITGYFGGTMVYEHGVGIHSTINQVNK